VVAAGEWKGKEPPTIKGTGCCIDAREAALRAVGGAGNFRHAVLRAANLDDEADTTAAIAGQLAGARWGASGTRRRGDRGSPTPTGSNRLPVISCESKTLSRSIHSSKSTKACVSSQAGPGGDAPYLSVLGRRVVAIRPERQPRLGTAMSDSISQIQNLLKSAASLCRLNGSQLSTRGSRRRRPVGWSGR
jgi:hypothetical protein